MRVLSLLVTLLPLLARTSPVPAILLTADGPRIVVRDAIPDPAKDVAIEDLEKRAVTVRNDVVAGICKPVTLIFARGTTEPGNMGLIIGPPFVSHRSASVGED